MKKVDEYISELLFKNDCVILPEFGGFITGYAPAHLHPTRHILYPPSKEILFNARLQRNDGLLANHIAENENITYEDAVISIRQFTTQCQATLHAGRNLVFEHIGTFLRNREGNLEFSPARDMNYLEEAFGLTKLVTPPVIKKEKQEKKSRVAIQRTTGANRPAARTFAVSAFVFILLAAIGTWSYYHSPLLKDIYTNYSGIIPLFKAIHEPAQPAADQVLTEPTIKLLEEPAPSQTEIQSPEHKTVTEIPSTPSPVVQEGAIHYYIIAGAFKEPANAEKLLNDLRSKGYNAQMAGRTKTGLYRVCYDAFSDKDQAIMALETIKRQDGPNAWLFVE